jgi:7-cyano-7-deazaguanine synthase
MAGARAIVLLSGGLDSATALAIGGAEGHACHALSFRYGRRHQVELDATRRVGESSHLEEHGIIDVELAAFGGSALTGAKIAVPKDRGEIGRVAAIPITHVPARNTISLSYALAWAEVLGAFDLSVDVNSTDYRGCPDFLAEFIAAFEAVANLATAAAVQGRGRYRIQTPIIDKAKAQIIRTGVRLGVDYSLTHSCVQTGFHFGHRLETVLWDNQQGR